MTDSVEPRLLRSFTMVAEVLNISLAANKLFISQPALSRQIKDLEQTLKVKLFDRESGRLSLTTAGAAFLPMALNLLQKNREAVEQMSSFHNVNASLTIGYRPLVMGHFLADVLKTFSVQHPSVTVTLLESSLIEQIQSLRSKAIDVAFIGTSAYAAQTEFETKHLYWTPLHIVLPETHRYAKNQTIDLSLLSSDPFVGLSEIHYPKHSKYIIEFCQSVGFTPTFQGTANCLSELFGLAAMGKGILMLPKDLSCFPHPGQVFVQMIRPLALAPNSVLWRKGPKSPALAALLACLAAKTDGLPDARKDMDVAKATTIWKKSAKTRDPA